MIGQKGDRTLYRYEAYAEGRLDDCWCYHIGHGASMMLQIVTFVLPAFMRVSGLNSV